MTFYDFSESSFQFKQWSESDDNVNLQTHVKNCLSVAIQEELTDTQKIYFEKYHMSHWSIRAIAETYGVNKSTVSRALKAAHKNIAKVMRYSSPYLLHKQKSEYNRRMKL